MSVGSRLLGWRITTTDRVTDQAHEYWVQDGRIHHVLLTPAQSGIKGTDFVIGRLVRRIPALSKNAILKAINEWNAEWI